MMPSKVRTWIIGTLLALQLPVSAQSGFDYFFLEAEKSRLAGDYASAFDLYRHSLQIRPETPAVLYQMSLMYYAMRQDSIATVLIRNACRIDSTNPVYLETLASAYLEKRNTREVIPVLERLARIQSFRTDVLVRLSDIYITVGDNQKALQSLARVELLEGKSTALTIQKYALRMEMNQQDSAFWELHSLCKEYPHDMNSRVLLANKYQSIGQLDSALAIYDYVREQDPTNVNLALAMMKYHEDLGDTVRSLHIRDSLLFSPFTGTELQAILMRKYIQDAMQDTTLTRETNHIFDSLLTLPQKDAQLLTLRVGYQMYLKQSEDSIAHTFRRILQVEPSNQMAMSYLLRYYAPRRKFQEMEDICRRGVNHYPDELLYHYYLGVSLLQQEKDTLAADALRQGLRLKKEDAPVDLVSDAYSLVGDIMHQQNRHTEAFAAYDSALVYRPDNISCLNNYAYYLSLRNEQLDKAEEMSYRTVKAEPKNETYLDTYAWILFMKGDYQNARIYIDQVVNLELSDEEILSQDNLQGTVLEHAGDIYMMCGEKDTALHLWQLAQKKNDSTTTPALNKKIKRKKFIPHTIDF